MPSHHVIWVLIMIALFRLTGVAFLIGCTLGTATSLAQVVPAPPVVVVSSAKIKPIVKANSVLRKDGDYDIDFEVVYTVGSKDTFSTEGVYVSRIASGPFDSDTLTAVSRGPGDELAKGQSVTIKYSFVGKRARDYKIGVTMTVLDAATNLREYKLARSITVPGRDQ